MLGTNRIRALALTAAMVPALAAPSARAQAIPSCAQPGRILEELDFFLRNGSEKRVCEWRGHIRFDYNQWAITSSHNLPVCAAAAALFVQPVQPGGDIRTWWKTYLEAQVAGRNTFPGGGALPSAMTYFHSTEACSFTYDWPVVTSVLAVHFWAQQNPTQLNAAALRTLARKYLRGSWALYGLAAGTGPAATGYRNGVLFTDKLQRASLGFFYTGPYVALAGARSNSGHWGNDGRGYLVTRAMNRSFAGPAPSREPAGQAGIRTWVEPRWSGPGESVYGLSTSDVAALRQLVDSKLVPASLNADLSGLRARSTFHFIAQPRFSGTCMDRAWNGNGEATFAVGYFSDPQLGAVPGEAHFLQSGQTNGAGTCEVDVAARQFRARNGSGVLQGTITWPNVPLFYYFTFGPGGLVRVL